MLLRTFDARKAAGRRKDQLLEDIIHVTDFMRKQRDLVEREIKFESAFGTNCETVLREERDGVVSAQFEALALDVHNRHGIKERIKTVGAFLEDVTGYTLLSYANDER